MPIAQWLRRLRPVRKPDAARRAKNALSFETLEDRAVPAATVRTYDENLIATNTVDFTATGSSMTSTQFAASVATAFDQNKGGVIDGTLLSGVYEYGTSLNRQLRVEQVRNLWGIGVPGGGRTISETGAFATVGLTGTETSTTLGFSPFGSTPSNERIVQLGVTALSLTGRNYGNVTVTVALGGGGTMSATRPISEANGQGDTFFGFTAPAGDYISQMTIGYDGAVVPDVRLWFDDLGFITGPIVANQGPTGLDDDYSVNEDQTLTVNSPGVLGNDTDPTSDPLTAVLVAGPAHGQLTFNTNGSFTYTPAANYYGSDSFTYRPNDGAADGNITTVNLNINPINDAPALNGATFSIPENSPAGTVVGTVSGTDVDGNALSYSLEAGNTGGTFAIDPQSGQITVTDSALLDYETTPQFVLTVRATDPGGLFADATVTVDLTDVAEVIPVGIDIMPEQSSNVVSIKSHGRFDVAIFSTDAFDAAEVDVDTIRFGHDGTEDSLSRKPNGQPRVRLTDLNADGRLDLIFSVESERTGFQIGDTFGYLTGRTLDGLDLAGEDGIVVKKPGSK
jgi:VCBS repeat-containing protein